MKSDIQLEKRFEQLTAEVDTFGREMIFRLDTMTQFSWDTVIVLQPYSSIERMEEKTKIDLKVLNKTRIVKDEVSNVLAFVNNGKLVNYVDLSRAHGDFGRLDSNEIILHRKDALFIFNPDHIIQRLEIENYSEALLEIDYSDKNYSKFLQYSTHDTTTADGFNIEYFVKPYSKYKDLYIQWSKGAFKDMFCCKEVLFMHDYEYIPVLVDETDEYIIMNSDCAEMECSSLLFLTKNKDNPSFQLDGVLNSFKNNNIILYSNKLSSSPTKEFRAININLRIDAPITFDKEVVYISSSLRDRTLTIVGLSEGDENKKISKSIEINE